MTLVVPSPSPMVVSHVYVSPLSLFLFSVTIKFSFGIWGDFRFFFPLFFSKQRVESLGGFAYIGNSMATRSYGFIYIYIDCAPDEETRRFLRSS